MRSRGKRIAIGLGAAFVPAAIFGVLIPQGIVILALLIAGLCVGCAMMVHGAYQMMERP